MDIWTAISAVSSAVAALAALRAIQQVNAARREDDARKRPHFISQLPTWSVKKGVRYQHDLREYSYVVIELTLTNIGVHPAANLTGEFLMTELNLQNVSPLFREISVANELPNSASVSIKQSFEDDCDSLYVIATIRYMDAILVTSHGNYSAYLDTIYAI